MRNLVFLIMLSVIVAACNFGNYKKGKGNYEGTYSSVLRNNECEVKVLSEPHEPLFRHHAFKDEQELSKKVYKNVFTSLQCKEKARADANALCGSSPDKRVITYNRWRHNGKTDYTGVDLSCS